MSKSPLFSKTLWVNLVAIAAMFIQTRFGFVVSPEYQGAILGVVNLVLRAVTKQPLDWGAVNNNRGATSAGAVSFCFSFLAGCLLVLLLAAW